MAIEEQVRAYGGPRFQLTQQVMLRLAEAIEQAKIDLVPKIVIDGAHAGDGAAGGFGGGNLFQGLMALLLAERSGIEVGASTTAPRPEAQAVRESIRGRIA
jgi:hypothetical protein